jgi:hypothetical protein
MPVMLWIWTGAVACVLLPLEWFVRWRLTKMPPVKYFLQVAPHAAAVALLCAAGTIAPGHVRGSLVPTIMAMAAYCIAYGIYALVMYRFYRVPAEGAKD